MNGAPGQPPEPLCGGFLSLTTEPLNCRDLCVESWDFFAQPRLLGLAVVLFLLEVTLHHLGLLSKQVGSVLFSNENRSGFVFSLLPGVKRKSAVRHLRVEAHTNPAAINERLGLSSQPQAVGLRKLNGMEQITLGAPASLRSATQTCSVEALSSSPRCAPDSQFSPPHMGLSLPTEAEYQRTLQNRTPILERECGRLPTSSQASFQPIETQFVGGSGVSSQKNPFTCPAALYPRVTIR